MFYFSSPLSLCSFLSCPFLEKTAQRLKIDPVLGVRAQLSVRSIGQWSGTSGEHAKVWIERVSRNQRRKKRSFLARSYLTSFPPPSLVCLRRASSKLWISSRQSARPVGSSFCTSTLDLRLRKRNMRAQWRALGLRPGPLIPQEWKDEYIICLLKLLFSLHLHHSIYLYISLFSLSLSLSLSLSSIDLPNFCD